MRQRVGYVLIALGGVAFGLGLLIRSYLYPTLVKLPLDPAAATGQTSLLTVLTATDGTYLAVDNGTPVVKHGTITIRATVAGDLTAPEVSPGGSVAAWRTGVTVMAGDTLVGITTMEVCLDRHTAMAVSNCSRASLQIADQKVDPPDIEGLTGTFPFNTQKQQYPFFDTALHQAMSVQYTGTDVLNGVTVYKFVESVPPTRTMDVQVPGNLVNGDAKKSVTAGLYYDINQTFWVEPATGAPVKTQQVIRQQLHGPDGRPGAVVLSGTFNMSDATVRQLCQQAAAGRAQLQTLTGAPPTVALFGGLLLIGLGVVLVLRARNHRYTRLLGTHRNNGPAEEPWWSDTQQHAMVDTDVFPNIRTEAN
ncbi:MAG TPA: DUF3068 domain-containing protein [Rugosimonospora sp.]|nr:DUF3068 domain-containing protein [Rugosimonospora sp.]